MLVIGRVPVIAEALIRDPELARRSLVVHVNLAMGTWFLSCVAGLFCLLPSVRRTRFAPTAVVLAALGAVVFTIPVFFSDASPILSNYVAALDHKLFLAGLVLFAAGVLLNFVDRRLLVGVPITVAADSGLPVDAQFAVRAAVWTFLLALLTFAGSSVTQEAGMTPLEYYERLFWGGGHVLQAFNTFGMLAGWLILLSGLTGRVTVQAKWAALLFGLMLLPHLAGPWLTFGNHSGRWFTRMMQYGLFPVATIILLAGIHSLWKYRDRLAPGAFESPAFIGLATSAAMTVAGFVLGAMITADTTLIPAHYHANIGAVSVAYMAVLLTMLPRLGGALRWPRLAAWQPLLYGVGQMTFVLGLAVAGTLGQAARKTYGGDQQLNLSAEWIGLIIVGIGGVIALAGGVLFIAVAGEAAFKLARRQTAPTGDP